MRLFLRKLEETESFEIFKEVPFNFRKVLIQEDNSIILKLLISTYLQHRGLQLSSTCASENQRGHSYDIRGHSYDSGRLPT